MVNKFEAYTAIGALGWVAFMFAIAWFKTEFEKQRLENEIKVLNRLLQKYKEETTK